MDIVEAIHDTGLSDRELIKALHWGDHIWCDCSYNSFVTQLFEATL